MNANYLDYLTAKKSSENTKTAYIKAISDCLDYIAKSDLEISALDITKWMAHLSDMSSATIALKLSAVKSYFKFLKVYGIRNENPTEDIEAPSIKNKAKHYMDSDMISAMLAACRHPRDNAVILCYATTGMRYSELSKIRFEDWNKMLANGVNYITITGKGNKQRNVYFNEQTMAAIKKYLRFRRANSEYLFCTDSGKQIERCAMSNMLKSTAKRAGIPFAEDISNHAMRAAAASIMSDNGIPVAVIRDTLGHSTIQVTSRYIKTSEQLINNANAGMKF